MDRFDVAVVGGGPSGSTTAYHLAKAGANLVEDALVRSVELREGCATLTTSKGLLSAGVVVGADGANGSVARSLGLAPAPDPPIALEANFNYRSSQSGESRCPGGWQGIFALELGSLDGGYGWSFPKSDHFNVGCGGFRSQGGRLRQHLTALGGHYALDRESMVNVRGHHVPTRVEGAAIVQGIGLLVGDAAGLVDPMSGEGIYAAFVSGRLAAEAALVYLDGKSNDLSGYEAAIDQALMRDIRAATVLRDAYHFMPRPCYAVMRRSALVRAAVCKLMVGEKTYEDFLGQAGPLRPLVSFLAALGRRSRPRRAERARRGLTRAALP